MSEFDAIPSATITADLGQGVVEQTVTSWSIDRTLSGGGLPGQARAASGSSVGSGSVSVESDATPWNAGAIKPAGRVTVSASEDVGTAASRVGTMVVRSVGAPSALSSQRDLSIEDDLGGLRGAVTIPVTLARAKRFYGDSPDETVPVDASWATVSAAAASGMPTVPATVPSAFLSVPAVGSALPDVGELRQTTISRWGSVDGHIAAVPDGGNSQTVIAGGGGELPSRFFVTVSKGGNAYVRLGHDDDVGGSVVFIDLSGDDYRVATASQTSAFAPFPDPPGHEVFSYEWPSLQRVQLDVELTGVSGGVTAGVRARGRLAADAAWGAWVSASGSFTIPTATRVYAATNNVPGDAWRGLQVHKDDDSRVWEATRTRIAASGSSLRAITSPSTTTCWSLTQEVAAATLGAVWIDEDGVLVYRNREQLRGSGTPTETVYSLDSLDDVPWEVSTDDVADRVEVSYNPPAITQASDYSATVWQSTEVVTIRAGQTVTIEQDIDGAADDLAPWYPAWNTTIAPATRYSRWAASTLPGGGGDPPADDALQITAEMVNPSKVRIRIRNTTTGTLYTAGTDGTTLLTLRANVVARPSEPLTLSTGLPADKAIAPLSIDLGSWVQDQDTAQEILSWLTGTLSQPLPILRQVGVTPKASRRLGDVIVIRDPYTELASKALITGIHSSGEAGRYSQSLDLAILATTFDDMDTWSVANGITTFDQLDAFLTANGIDTFDKWDAYTARIGGNL